MKISNNTYESLTPAQRVSATFDALARRDEQEVKKLKETCGFESLKQRDSKYSDVVLFIIELALMIECDLRGLSLNYFMLNPAHEKEARGSLQEMSNICEAWNRFLTENAISKSAFAGMDFPFHIAVQELIVKCPPPDETKVSEYTKLYKNGIEAC